MEEEKKNKENEEILDIETESEHDCSHCPGCSHGCFHDEKEEE